MTQKSKQTKIEAKKYESNTVNKFYIPDVQIYSMNTSEIVSFLWEKQEFLRSHYKQNKYKDVILPLVVLTRLDIELK